MSSEFKLSDQTSVALPVKNIVAIISAIVVAVWTYFGIVERLNRLETNEKLMAQDLLKKAEQTPKNQEMYMLIEYQAKSIDKHSKQLEENVHTKVLIAQLEKKVDNAEIFKLISPAFQTIIGGFIGLLAGVKLKSGDEDKICSCKK